MSEMPLVSIVTPSLNQGAYIGQTIETVLNQSYAHLEYWVMDGGSDDNTLSILQQYADDGRFHWLSEADTGQSAAIAKGWQRCQGEIIAWLNADDRYCLQAVETAVAAFRHHPQANVVCGSAAVIDQNRKTIDRIPAPHLTLTQMLQLHDFWPQPAVFMRATAVQQVGGLSTRLQYAMDLDLFLRLAATGQVIYIDDTLAEYRLHREAKTAKYLPEMRKEAAQVARQFLDSNVAKQQVNGRLTALHSHTHLVEAYADFCLGNLPGFLQHTAVGLWHSPQRLGEVIQRARRHLQKGEAN